MLDSPPRRSKGRDPVGDRGDRACHGGPLLRPLQAPGGVADLADMLPYRAVAVWETSKVLSADPEPGRADLFRVSRDQPWAGDAIQ
jgi:hypothetical protein